MDPLLASRLARRLRLRDLHTLLVVLDCGSMAKAAGVLALTQPAVSKAMQEMEMELGVPLLERDARGVRPTVFGEAMAARARAMVDELGQGARDLAHLADPDVGEVLRRLGSARVRNSGTLVANIGNGSPIGDTPPLLIALGATLTLRRGEARRDLPLEAYFLDYGKQDRQPGEFIESVTVNRLPPGDVYAAYKLTKRFDQDISAVCAAFRFRIQGGHLADVRAAFGGMADIPKRAAACEAALVGQSWTEATIRAAMTALEADFTPLSDHRASATYRLATAKNLLLKAWLESGGELLRLVGQGSLADG